MAAAFGGRGPWYVGGNLGIGWSRQSVDFSTNDPATGAASLIAASGGIGAPISFNGVGPAIGLQVGYNWQVSQTWLVGFETDFDISGITGRRTSTTLFPFAIPPPFFQSTAEQSLEWFGTVRGRAGYLASNNLLVYGTGGFAYGRTAQHASYFNQSGTSFTGSNGQCNGNSLCYFGASHHIATGWTAGGGLEYVLSDHWTIKGEYLYIRLSGNTVAENVIPAGGFPINTSSINANFHDLAVNIVRAGVNYKF
jgi:outer membrane immunogenic protein